MIASRGDSGCPASAATALSRSTESLATSAAHTAERWASSNNRRSAASTASAPPSVKGMKDRRNASWAAANPRGRPRGWRGGRPHSGRFTTSAFAGTGQVGRSEPSTVSATTVKACPAAPRTSWSIHRLTPPALYGYEPSETSATRDGRVAPAGRRGPVGDPPP